MLPYTPSPHLWTPQRRGLDQAIRLLESGHDLCLYGPTGSGKTTIAHELCRWSSAKGWGSCFYVNRKILVGQTLSRFKDLDVAVRAADYDDLWDDEALVQICSADTERSRVYRNRTCFLHDAQLVVVDEAHIQKGETMQQIVEDHRRNGARIVLLTATPLGLREPFGVNKLIVSGSMKEYRECGAIVLAEVKSIEQPDMRKVKRKKTGEFIMNGRKRQIFTQHIVGNVISSWERLNGGLPTLAYWPGKPESYWGTTKFEERGIPWAHIDASEIYLNGKIYKRTRSLYEDMVGQLRDGTIKGVSSRFVLREGVDLPFVYHGILATPIGSISSYIQVCGRILRKSPETPDRVLITDHGGNYWRHLSPNMDRPWRKWWNMKEPHVAQEIARGMREHGEPEPIRCGECGGERMKGRVCPFCGHESDKSVRKVVQENGIVKTVEGKLVKPPRTKRHPDTQQKWENMFHAFRRGRKERTFAQMEAFFAYEHGYHPPRDLPYMPKTKEVWSQLVYKIDFRDLITPQEATCT